MNNIQVAENFRLREFQCRDGSYQVVLHSGLLQKLQALRSALQRPVLITSGYRNPVHNARVGGAPNSLHLKGMAADIYVRGLSLEQLARAARDLDFTGIGIYGAFLHVDIRENHKIRKPNGIFNK